MAALWLRGVALRGPRFKYRMHGVLGCIQLEVEAGYA